MFFASVVQIGGEPKAMSDMKYNYRRLFFEMIDSVSGMSQERFLDL